MGANKHAIDNKVGYRQLVPEREQIYAAAPPADHPHHETKVQEFFTFFLTMWNASSAMCHLVFSVLVDISAKVPARHHCIRIFATKKIKSVKEHHRVREEVIQCLDSSSN